MRIDILSHSQDGHQSCPTIKGDDDCKRLSVPPQVKLAFKIESNKRVIAPPCLLCTSSTLYNVGALHSSPHGSQFQALALSLALISMATRSTLLYAELFTAALWWSELKTRFCVNVFFFHNCCLVIESAL